MGNVSHNVKCVSLEGNVGCGKSSTLGILKQKGYTVVPEPIKKWGATLDLFYSNPQKYCYVFQTRVLAELITMREKILNASKPHKDNVIFFERSQMGAKVFLEVAVDNGDMHRAEHETYLRLEAIMLQARPAVARANVHVLIDTPPDQCCARIVQRERQAEQDGPLMSTAAQRHRYIQQIHDKQEEVFKAVDVIRVDGMLQPENVAEAVLSAMHL